MGQLAEIWHDRGESQGARDLLVDCLQKLIVMFQESKYNSDRETFAEEFRVHRETYLRLWPGSERDLSEMKLPEKLA